MNRNHVLFTSLVNQASACIPVLEQGFGVGFGGVGDDSNFMYDHVVGPLPPGSEDAFKVPPQCTKFL